ncbi:MAG: PDZ domain-containing protein [Planctomycetes bacterium]|nr:PDZ domain-containing protein [Planctomycetota bacterium]
MGGDHFHGFRLLGLLAACSFGNLEARQLPAEEPPAVDSPRELRDNPAAGPRRGEGRGERSWRYRTQPAYQRDNAKVKEAFRDVVAAPKDYTVRVFSNAEPVALGIIVDSEGLILTKASELAATITVRLADSRRFPAETLATRGDLDIALLKIDAGDLPTVGWATDPTPEVGSWLATPAQEELPISIGVVSGAPRRITAPRAMLGVILEEHDPRVVSVMEGSGAERAGIQPMDLITRVNGLEVDSRENLVSTLEKHRVGDKVELIVRRGDQELTMQAVMSDRAAGPRSERADFQNGLGGKLSDRRAGFPLVIPHDSVLRPNECGGPLVNLDGRTVGVNIARAGRVASYALPASVLMPAIAEMKSTIAATPASVEVPEKENSDTPEK